MRRITGKHLNNEWHVGALHSLYREDGTWYHRLEKFPGALFDKSGYLLFETRHVYENCPGLLIGSEKNWANAPAGIANLEGYVRVL